MQIIIPMSGFGERFRRAGYNVPKPLIEVEGKPIIAHVIDMFPGEHNFLFVCNKDHLANPDYNMEEILRTYCPTGVIAGIDPHKLGPINAVLQVEHMIDPEGPVVVNYCDFTCYWDWDHFKKFAIQSKSDGVIPAYKGFHPHSLGNTNYAYIKEASGWVTDIQEKKPFTSNRMEEYASSGTYYFSEGSLMLHAFKGVMEKDLNVNGEYYVSLAYKILLGSNKHTSVYELQHFMQWGTPEDVAQYNEWSKVFHAAKESKACNPQVGGSVVIPMAGLGQRFMNEGYTQTKPLIKVSGYPMVIQACRSLPNVEHQAFILRDDMPGLNEIKAELKEWYPNAILSSVKEVTQGQACSAKLGVEALENYSSKEEFNPITIGACDSAIIYDQEKFDELANSPDVDVIVWVYRGHSCAIHNPEMYGWVDEVEGVIREVSVKKPLINPAADPVVIGVFTFCSSSHFTSAVNSLIERDGRVNGEFYIDSCINDSIQAGNKCHIFEVDSFISWGTPNELKTFEYWQSCFSKWSSHPYTLESDHALNEDDLSVLRNSYHFSKPIILEPYCD